MAGNSKEIQRRIKSIGNTRKIPRGMEMVSASKMKKEINRVLQVREYARASWGVLTNLSKAFDRLEHGLLEVREVKRVLIVLITSNRGLCGAYNAQIIKKLSQQVKNPKLLKINRIGNEKIGSTIKDEDLEFDYIAVGKKGFNYLARRDKDVVASFEDFNYSPSVEAVRSLARIVIDDYVSGKYDKVVVAYTDFKNTAVQVPKLRQLLPISKIDIEKQIEEMNREDDVKDLKEKEEIIDYKIEPKPIKVLQQLLPRLVEVQLYHAVLESNASKESARMLAMKNASDAAADMITELQYSYNQIRQTGITQEIAEITSGRAALE